MNEEDTIQALVDEMAFMLRPCDTCSGELARVDDYTLRCACGDAEVRRDGLTLTRDCSVRPAPGTKVLTYGFVL